MRIEQLWYFKEVVESKSISKAANKIFITQQALSQALYNLETEIGVQLFIRTPKGIEVTQKGLIFYEATLKVLQNFGDLKTICWKMENDTTYEKTPIITGSLNVYCSSMILDHFVAPVVFHCNMLYPKAEINLIEKNINADILTEICQTNSIGIFCYITGEYTKNVNSDSEKNIWYERLFLDDLCIGVSLQSSLSKKKHISNEEFFQYPLAISANNLFTINQLHRKSQLHDDSSSIKIRLMTTKWQTVIQLVSENQAITVLPRQLLNLEERMNKKGIILIPFKEKYQLACSIIKTQNNINPLENIFIQEIRRNFNRTNLISNHD